MMLAKLSLLIAVLLMPFAMQPGAAAPVADGAASMLMQHCPEQGSAHDKKSLSAECTMICAAALPAAYLAQRQRLPETVVPAVSGVFQILHGLQPETATPPPRRS